MTDPTVTSDAPAAYLDRVAGTEAARAYKKDLLTALRIEPGNRVLDVGCGPGTDLASLAAAVGPAGTVIGVDQDPAMIATARARTADDLVIEIREGDAHHLPVDSGDVDRARADRVLMHVADPGAALAELHRVLRPGGLLTLAEPDWDTLAIDHPDLESARGFTRFVAEHVNRNQAIGRQLPRLATAAGFTVLAVRNAAVVFSDFETAEAVLGIRRNTERALAAGRLSNAEPWLAHLSTGVFFGTFSFITVLAQSAA